MRRHFQKLLKKRPTLYCLAFNSLLLCSSLSVFGSDEQVEAQHSVLKLSAEHLGKERSEKHRLDSSTKLEEAEEGEEINLLALDGGGIHGLYQATILARIEDRCNEILRREEHYRDRTFYLHEFFDLMGGTSIGAVNAVGLTLSTHKERGKPQFTGRSLVQFYYENAQKIFGAPSWWQSITSGFGLFGSIYPDPKSAFQGTVGTRTLKDLIPETRDFSQKKDKEEHHPKKVTILSYSLTDKRAYFFDSWTEEAGRTRILDALLASTAAPIYLPTHTTTIQDAQGQRQVTFADGGLSANNPSSLVIGKALKFFPPSKGYRYNLISIGCGRDPAPISLPQNPGVISWGLGRLSNLMTTMPSPYGFQLVNLNVGMTFPYVYIQIPLVEIIVDDQAADATSKLLLEGLGQKNNHIRLNPLYDATEADKFSDGSLAHLQYMTAVTNDYMKNNLDIEKTCQILVQRFLKRKR